VMEWRDAHIIPRYGSAGVRRFAFLMPVGFPNAGHEAFEGPAVFPTKWFVYREEALGLLQAGSVALARRHYSACNLRFPLSFLHWWRNGISPLSWQDFHFLKRWSRCFSYMRCGTFHRAPSRRARSAQPFLWMRWRQSRTVIWRLQSWP